MNGAPNASKVGHVRLSAAQWCALSALRQAAETGARAEGMTATAEAIHEALATGRPAREASGPLAAKVDGYWRITEVGHAVVLSFEDPKGAP